MSISRQLQWAELQLLIDYNLQYGSAHGFSIGNTYLQGMLRDTR